MKAYAVIKRARAHGCWIYYTGEDESGDPAFSWDVIDAYKFGDAAYIADLMSRPLDDGGIRLGPGYFTSETIYKRQR
jgi:hypothetical protein